MSHNTRSMATDRSTIKDQATQLADNADGPDVTVNQLTGGRGGLLYRTFTQTPPITYLDDSEQPHYTFKLGKPIGGTVTITKVHDDDSFKTPSERTLEPDPHILTLITEQRILIVGQENGVDNVLSIPHHNINTVEMREQDGFLNSNVELWVTTEDYEYCITINETVVHSLTDVPEFITTHKSTPTELPETHHFAADNTKLVCKECHGNIEPDAERCPHCGFAPKDKGHGALWHGTALATSFSPIGVAMMAKGVADEEKASNPIGKQVATQDDNSTQQNESTIDTLERLNTLKENGAITEQEFEETKRELLEQL